MDTNNLPNDRSKTVAFILALLLGSIGAHKFYMGKMKQGIIYLVLCWTGIPGIIGIIEAIFYLKSSDDEFYKKYRCGTKFFDIG